ncbi:hypothetical protein Tco_1022307 [Tanacetum coccineum]
MAGYKQSQLNNKSFAKIQKLFDKAMTKVNMFVDMDTKLVKESSKKAEAEMAQESSSKRAVLLVTTASNVSTARVKSAAGTIVTTSWSEVANAGRVYAGQEKRSKAYQRKDKDCLCDKYEIFL